MRIAVLLSTVLLAHAGALLAESDVVPAEPIVVTATRSARTADEALASVTVITREDIERRQWQDLNDLLRAQAGIDMTRSGGPSGNMALFMRGTNSNHVLVLIDGMRVASATTGTFDWRSIPLGQIERIEIVRGPRAALYGSDAIGGVVQIFTRRPRRPEIELGYGSDETYRADVAWGNAGAFHAFVTGTHFETRGFSAAKPGTFGFNADDDGARQQGVATGFETILDRGTRLEVLGRQSRGWSEFDQGISDIDIGNLNGRLSHQASSYWTQSLNLGVARDELVTQAGTSSSRIRTLRHSADWQHDFAFDAHSFATLGLGYVNESGISANNAGGTLFDREQSSRAAFGLWQNRYGRHDVQLSGRYDDYSTFGGHGTWSTAWGMELSNDMRGWISYGNAFRTPTFNQLYHPGCCGGLFAGNADLRPERSRSAELGLRYRPAPRHMTAISLFYSRVLDLIQLSGPNSQAENIAKASMRGAEIEHSYGGEQWRLSTALTLQRAMDETTDEPLVRRADRKVSAMIERRFERGGVGLEIVASSERKESDDSTIPGYGIANLAMRYAFANQWSLEGRIENLLDKDYENISGYNTQDRAAFVSLRYQHK